MQRYELTHDYISGKRLCGGDYTKCLNNLFLHDRPCLINSNVTSAPIKPTSHLRVKYYLPLMTELPLAQY